MTDLLKIYITDLNQITALKENTLIHWKQEKQRIVKDKKNNVFTDEIKTTLTKTYKGIDFNFGKQYKKNEIVEVIFKPHYYYNNGLHNANDFNCKDAKAVITNFGKLFNIDLDKALVMNIEFGINILSPICIKDLITYLAYQGKNPFVNNEDLAFSKFATSKNKEGYFNLFKVIKAYAKGLQFPQYCNINTFRFEVKSNRTEYIKKHLGVTYVSDLLNYEVYYKMGQILQKEFSSVLILEPVNNDYLKVSEQIKINELLNPNTWYRFIQSSNRNRFSDKIKQFNKLVSKDPNNTKKQLENCIKNKLIKLQKGCNFNTSKKIKKGADLSNSIVQICTFSLLTNCNNNTQRKCPVTGVNISMQKDNSKLLSNTGLRWLSNNNIKEFNKWVNILITGNHNEYEKDIFSKLSKQIRNRYYNNYDLYNSNQLKIW